MGFFLPFFLASKACLRRRRAIVLTGISSSIEARSISFLNAFSIRTRRASSYLPYFFPFSIGGNLPRKKGIDIRLIWYNIV